MDQKRFTAALKGIDLDQNRNDKFEEVKRRAEAKALGISEESLELDGYFDVIDE